MHKKNLIEKFLDFVLEKSAMSCLFWVLIIIILSIGTTLFIGWLLMLLWNWLAPLFWSSAPVLGYWQSVGMAILLTIIGGFFRSRISKN